MQERELEVHHLERLVPLAPQEGLAFDLILQAQHEVYREALEGLEEAIGHGYGLHFRHI